MTPHALLFGQSTVHTITTSFLAANHATSNQFARHSHTLDSHFFTSKPLSTTTTTMFQVKDALPPVSMCSTVFSARQLDSSDHAPRLPRRARFESRDTSPRLPLRSFQTVDMGQLSRAPPKRGVSRCNSRIGETALNKLHLPGQTTAATNTNQDVQVFKTLPLSASQMAAIMKLSMNWWET